MLSVVEARRGAKITIAGRDFLNFSSNDYLGLASDARLAELVRSESYRCGMGSGAAHLISGHARSHQALEEELADFLGYERVLLFSTGYMANLGVLSALANRQATIYQDRLNHASLIDGALLSGAKLQRYEHGGLPAMGPGICENSLIVTDGVFSMDGDFAEVRLLSDMARKTGALLIVDDAHGIGVLGERGRGILDVFGLDSADVPVVVGTLGKAFGTFGAFVAGSDLLIRYLIQKARTYRYTTAMPPLFAEASRKALEIVRSEPWRRVHLRNLIEQFRLGASELGLPLTSSTSPIQPLWVGDARRATELAARLWDHGILLCAIRPPTVPSGTARLRCTFSFAHASEDVDRLLEVLSSMRRDFMGVVS